MRPSSESGSRPASRSGTATLDRFERYSRRLRFRGDVGGVRLSPTRSCTLGPDLTLPGALLAVPSAQF